MVRVAANFFSVSRTDPIAEALIASLDLFTDYCICLQMPGAFWHPKYERYFIEFIGLHIDQKNDESLHDSITEGIRELRSNSNVLTEMPKLTWHILNYGNINVLLYRRRIFYRVREEWPAVTPNVEAVLADAEAARAKVSLPRIAAVISPLKPKQPYIEAVWHPLYGDDIAIRGLHHASGPADLSALVDGWGLLIKASKPRSGPSGDLENLVLDDLIDVVAYLWRTGQERGQRAPSAYDVSAYLEVERTTLYRYLKARQIDFKELKTQAKPRAESLTKEQVKGLERRLSSLKNAKLELFADNSP